MSGSSLGPWGEARAARATPAPAPSGPAALAQPPGQSPGWALLSTVLLAAYLWWAMKSWIYPVAGIIGILVHEYGHVLAFNALGMGPGRIFIVPFLGGAAAPRVPADTEWKDVLSSLAGPVFGMLAAAPFYVLWLQTGRAIWLEGAWFIAAINLLNLLPAPPLDGSKALGPVLARVHPWLEKGALLLVGAAVVVWGLRQGGLPIFPILIGIAVLGHLRRGRWRPHARQLGWGAAAASLGLYLLACLLCAGSLLFFTLSMPSEAAALAAEIGPAP
ncbi:MAG: peptidase M50 [Caulobacteraceae bacterium]|nr:peptidase M50 [Caulobacteraceae bacterium]